MYYTYQALSAEADTRIIELEPALDVSSPLRCRIAEFCLSSEDLIEYEALSYAWGDPIFSESLWIVEDDGTTSILKITRNLRNALQRLRLPDQPRLIWADAVCINQQDNSDKRHQIPAMTQIYSSASRVLVWLGWSDEGQQALGYIKRTMRFYSKDGTKVDAHMSNLAKAFDILMRLPWFSRRWVIQEVVMAADVVMICGAEDFSFMHLLRIMNDLLRDARLPSPTIQRALVPLTAISKLWKTWVFDSNQKEGLRLLHLLVLFQDSGCAVDHDRVFALCGLASDCLITEWLDEKRTPGKISVMVDYHQSTEWLYQSIAEQSITLTQDNMNNYIAEALLERWDGINRVHIPVWVPDWRLPRRRECLRKLFKDRRVRNFGSFPHEIKNDINPLQQRTGSSEETEEIARAISVLEPFPEDPRINEIRDWLKIMRIDFSEYSRYFPKVEFAHAWLRTELRQYFDIDVSNLPPRNYDTLIHPDTAWCYFLAQTSVQRAETMASRSKTRTAPFYSARTVYGMSVGRFDNDTGPEFWSYLRSVFRGRRLFAYIVDNDPKGDLFGVGIGPDHMTVGTSFITQFSPPSTNPFHATSWKPQNGRAPDLVGDVWHFKLGPDGLASSLGFLRQMEWLDRPV